MDDLSSTIQDSLIHVDTLIYPNNKLDGIIHIWPWHTFQGHTHPSRILSFGWSLINYSIYQIYHLQADAHQQNKSLGRMSDLDPLFNVTDSQFWILFLDNFSISQYTSFKFSRLIHLNTWEYTLRKYSGDHSQIET